MAANFWTSSHYRTLHDEEKVGHVLPADGQRGLTEEDIKVIKISMSQYIKSLAQQAKVRHRVVATAITYFRRVYTRKSFSEFDPCLVAPTCLYLASKAEESTVPAKHLIYYMKKTYQDDKGSFEVKDVLEMEMKLLEALDYYLVVYHPYRPLVRFLQDAGLNELIQDAWSLVNDTYKTDLVLMYPPHMIALSCIFLSSVLKEKDTISWFEDLRIDLNMLKNICMVMLDFYDNYQHVELLDDRVHVALNKIRQR
ncbi:hypothetical protein KP509_20G046800 [Ceratopteris richardii]|uniref:Cyclin-like domain-containing protein n=1 Tax=Ceratopteris richardii TaxID=49495 RepID=A0A8T2SFP6_CERRI|nr:hypothetical protein KP509_20G046800 [Ceratopteris richardii]KAH7331699.1 hypothetical protein KP509_20G046800 [Ceratopteris richardii]